MLRSAAMRVSLNWLRELLPSIGDSKPEEVGELLTKVGLEVEEIRETGLGLESLLICAVLAVEPHPHRDKLQLVTVNCGEARQRVVCGAKNVPEPGGLVALAPLGSHLPAIGMTLEARSLGGIISEGMLCSEVELGLGTDTTGILTFAPGRFAAGTRFLEVFPSARDTVFEIGITPNRPDALGHIGVARDLAAVLGVDWQPSAVVGGPRAPTAELEGLIRIDNRAPDACPRYGAALVRNVQVAPSPEWLRWRLHALGIRPISNVVDITNLLLLEFGNPMHAFDLNRIAGRTIVIRPANDGERMTTLDGEERKLLPTDLVIGDAERAAALAGIMGGADSEIREDTHDVLLECAYFEPRGVRRTARRLAMHSDSSFRFERGVNWSALSNVLQRASNLLCELAGGKAVPGQLFADGTPPELPRIVLRKRQMERLLGMPVDFDHAVTSLRRLGFSIDHATSDQVSVEGCPHRPDVTLEADLIEEVARIVGLDQIPTRLPRIAPQAPNAAGGLERAVRHWAAATGLSEAVTYSFVSPRDLAAVRAPVASVILQNPLTQERSVMTTSLLPGLLECVGRAQRHGEEDLRLFSVASRFVDSVPRADRTAPRPRAEQDVGKLPSERLSFAAVLVGHRPAHLTKPQAYDVFDAKGLIVELVESFTRKTPEVRWTGADPSPTPHLHPRGAAQIWLDGTWLGNFGPLHPDVAGELSLDGAIQIVEVDLDVLESFAQSKPRYRPIPRLPAVTRDIAVEVDAGVSAGSIQETIRTSAGELCESVTLFDLFQNEKMKPGHRSLAFRLVYRDPKAASDPDNAKTLTDKQVDKQHDKVVAAVQRLGAVPRA